MELLLSNYEYQNDLFDIDFTFVEVWPEYLVPQDTDIWPMEIVKQ